MALQSNFTLQCLPTICNPHTPQSTMADNSQFPYTTAQCQLHHMVSIPICFQPHQHLKVYKSNNGALY